MFIEQPKWFQNHHFSDHVLWLKKALYGLKQALRDWYDCLTTYLLDHGFKRGHADHTFFVKRDENPFLVAQVYVDDIVFGLSIDSLAQEFLEEMKKEFEICLPSRVDHLSLEQIPRHGRFRRLVSLAIPVKNGE